MRIHASSVPKSRRLLRAGGLAFVLAMSSLPVRAGRAPAPAAVVVPARPTAGTRSPDAAALLLSGVGLLALGTLLRRRQAAEDGAAAAPRPAQVPLV